MVREPERVDIELRGLLQIADGEDQAGIDDARHASLLRSASGRVRMPSGIVL
jgi:hypothetical protein